MNQNNICHYDGCKQLHKKKGGVIFCKTHLVSGLLTDIVKEKGITKIILDIRNEIETRTTCEETGRYQFQCETCPSKVCHRMQTYHQHGYIKKCFFVNCQYCKKIICRSCMTHDSEIGMYEFLCPECMTYDDYNESSDDEN